MGPTVHDALVLLAQAEGAGRGDNPSDAGGLLLIAGVIVVAAAVIVGICYLIARATARRRAGSPRVPGKEG